MNGRASILRRLDRLALTQLRSEAARLHQENECLLHQLHQAEDSSEFWRGEAIANQLALCEATDGQPGITQEGALVVLANHRQPEEG